MRMLIAEIVSPECRLANIHDDVHQFLRRM